MVENLANIFGRWGYDLKCFHPELTIAGSPERALKREILETSTGELFVLEQLPVAHREARLLQAQTLHYLAQHGVEGVHPWLADVSGEFGTMQDGFFWQLRRWIEGVSLPRDSYANDAWRGNASAEFLIALKKASSLQEMPGMGGYTFTLMHYIGHLLEHFKRQIPVLVDDVKPMIAELQSYHEYEENLAGRGSFCHGDFHPGNIIWSDKGINGVIDWEFNGSKPAAYDMANLLGCLGMDAPENLTNPYAMTFVKALRDANFLTDEEWHFLPDQIAALRFGWLREWVARKDKAMITQELDFIWLILDNRELLRSKWK